MLRIHRAFKHLRIAVLFRAGVCLLLGASASCDLRAQTSEAAQAGAGAFERLSAQAAKASEQNRLEEAAALYRKALALRPKWAEGWWSLGTLLYDQSKYAEAAKAFQRVDALDSKNGTARVMLGLSQYELGQDDSALANLQAGRKLGVADNPQMRNVMLYHEGLLLLRKGQFGNAQEPLKRLSRDGVQSEDLYLALGMCALMMRPVDLPDKKAPGRGVVLEAGKAEALASLDKFGDARRSFAELANVFPDYPNLHYAYGRFLLETHDTDAAVSQFKAELQNNPRHLNSLLEIAAVRYRSDSDDAIKYAKEAVGLAPKLPFAHYLLGLLLLDTGNAAEALGELEMARRAFPNEPSVYFALGSAYAKTGRKADAAKARAMFLRLNAKKTRQPAETVYGEQPSGLTQDRLQKASPEQPYE